MRVIRFKGKTAYLKERHWKQLIRRFNPTEEELKEGIIREVCILCAEFKPDLFSTECYNCPFSIWKDPTSPIGCFNLLKSVIPEKSQAFHLWGTFIKFKPKDPAVVKGQLAKIRQALLRLPRKGGGKE